MNMIPMVDIIFQLIIFFLVAMQVKENKVTKLQLPLANYAKKVEKEETAIVINILSRKADKTHPYRIQQQALDEKGLTLLLMHTRKKVQVEKKEMPVVRIRADMDSEFDDIKKALYACRAAFIWQVRLTAKKPSK